MTQEEKVAFWNENLPALQGKRVKVTTKIPADVDVSPGQAPSNYNLVDYYGIVQSPPIQLWPPENPTIPCFVIQTWDQLMQSFAIALNVIEEVDDEIEQTPPKEIAMSGLTSV